MFYDILFQGKSISFKLLKLFKQLHLDIFVLNTNSHIPLSIVSASFALKLHIISINEQIFFMNIFFLSNIKWASREHQTYKCMKKISFSDTFFFVFGTRLP